jgi:NADH dehydrogenase [ubiquinone] 1 alpha subcomplex assembly factor 7
VGQAGAEVNALARLLARRIRLTGPITVADYMAEALGHPEHGYYRRGDPLGARGDFITAPEVSQMFGELIGLWCVECWLRLGEPDPFVLLELGPGRGTLMADALRAARVRPQFLAALRLHLVEMNETLRERQAAAIASAAAGVSPQWHESLATVPRGTLLAIANEFFDALPIHQFERMPSGWRERHVDLDETGELCLRLGPPSAPFALTTPHQRGLPIGSVVEFAPAAMRIAGEVARRIAAGRGMALIIDYGDERIQREKLAPTLRAARGHEWHHPLTDPGSADLTADVDFGLLSRSAGHARAPFVGPRPQAMFLQRLGIEARAATLRRHATPEQAQAIDAALHRLLAPEEMGRVFKVATIFHDSNMRPPGFEKDDDTRRSA